MVVLVRKHQEVKKHVGKTLTASREPDRPRSLRCWEAFSLQQRELIKPCGNTMSDPQARPRFGTAIRAARLSTILLSLGCLGTCTTGV